MTQQTKSSTGRTFEKEILLPARDINGVELDLGKMDSEIENGILSIVAEIFEDFNQTLLVGTALTKVIYIKIRMKFLYFFRKCMSFGEVSKIFEMYQYFCKCNLIPERDVQITRKYDHQIVF